jgi:drug/metabolite transporter (DMT)-like permease
MSFRDAGALRQGGALYGTAMAVLGTLSFSVNDMLIKSMSGDYALHQVTLFRAAGACLFLFGVALPLMGGWSQLRMARPWMHLWRGLLVVAANGLFFMGLASLPLAEGVAISFVAPLIITLLSVVVLRETVGPWRWGSIVLGMIGVLVIVRPGTEAFQWAALLPVGGAVCYAVMQIVTRRIGAGESAVMLAITIQGAFIASSALSGLVLGHGRWEDIAGPSVAFLMRGWVWPAAEDWWVFLLMGVASGAGGFFISAAYRSTDAALVASFEYLAMPMALMWGLLVFGEWPGAVELAGIGLILAAGLVLVWRESRRRPPPLARGGTA